MEFTKEVIIFLKDGICTMQKNTESKMVEILQNIQHLNGEWKIYFAKGWGAPDSTIFPELTSLTNNNNTGIMYYSGIGTYNKTFQFKGPVSPSNDQRTFLDLGDLSIVAQVWLNDQYLGIFWTRPLRTDITDYIKNGENKITVKVAYVWSNRLTGDAVTGEKYTNTNITGNGNNLTPWAKVPLVESGLLRPVAIQRSSFVH